MPLKVVEQNGQRSIKLLPWQSQVLACDVPIVALFAGVQVGKTTIFGCKLAKLASEHPGEDFAITAPTLPQLKAVPLDRFMEIIKLLELVKGKEEKWHNKTDKVIRLVNGSRIYYASADDPERLQGMTLRGFWGDEMQRLNDGGRTLEVMKSRVAVKRGQILLSGLIPKPDELIGHWIFDKVYIPAQRGDQGIKLFQFYSKDNPFFPKERYEEARRTLPPEIFASEYEGKFVPGMSRDLLIPPELIGPAQELWNKKVAAVPDKLLQWAKQQQPAWLELPFPDKGSDKDPGGCIDLCLDAAREGGDRNVVTVSFEGFPLMQIDWGKMDSHSSSQQIMMLGQELSGLGYYTRYWIDMPGVGGGVFDQLYANGADVLEYQPNSPPLNRPENFSNLKAYIGWELRRGLVDGKEPLPPLSNLAHNLTRYRFKYQSGKLCIIDPDPSPDFGDSYFVKVYAQAMTMGSEIYLGGAEDNVVVATSD